MNNSFSDERRMFQRYPSTTPIILNADNFVSSGFLMNISKKGVGLKCNSSFSDQLEVGAKVELIIKDKNKSLRRNATVLDAVVCWTDEETKKAGLSLINGIQLKPKNDFTDSMPKDNSNLTGIQDEPPNSIINLIKISENLFSANDEINSAIGIKDDFDSKNPESLAQTTNAKIFLSENSQKELVDTLLILSEQIKERFHLVNEQFLKTEKIAVEKSAKVDELEKAILSFRLLMEAIFHDINNINTIIFGNAELIKCRLDEGIEEKQRNVLEIFNAGVRLAEIIRIAQKLCTNRFAIEPTKIKINSLFSELQFVRRDADLDNNVNFELLPNSNIENFVAHKESLMNLLFQIVQNARRHSPEGGTIRIGFNECQQDKQRLIEITIEDEGGGIPEENLNRIFESKFTTKKDGKGGLGLTIAKNIIRSMGGDIVVENVVSKSGSKGAKFTVYFSDKSTKSEH